MEQRTLARWLKILVIFAAVCGLVLCAGIIPMAGRHLVLEYPEFAHWFLPWLFFLWILAIPCFWALWLAWKIFSNIEKDESFCMANAEYLKRFSYLAVFDTVTLFVGSVVYWLIGWNHPFFLLKAIIVCIVGIAIAVASACLSHLVRKAAVLQEQSDLTI